MKTLLDLYNDLTSRQKIFAVAVVVVSTLVILNWLRG